MNIAPDRQKSARTRNWLMWHPDQKHHRQIHRPNQPLPWCWIRRIANTFLTLGRCKPDRKLRLNSDPFLTIPFLQRRWLATHRKQKCGALWAAGHRSPVPGDGRLFADQVRLFINGCLFITVVDHPYFAVSGKDGKFKISNVPPGKYTWKPCIARPTAASR